MSMERCMENAEIYCKSYPRCYGCGAFREPTNADRIRAMSDEELAKWMAECNAYGERAEASQWLPWLKEPVGD